jgi:hypothetical protein
MRVCILALFLSGCTILGTADIKCWYTQQYVQLAYTDIRYKLMGRTDKFHNDVEGSVFKTQDDVNKYIATYNLTMCAVNR